MTHPALPITASWERDANLYRDALRTASEGIIIADNRHAECPIVFANHGFTQLTGYAESDVIGRNCRFLQGDETCRESVREVGGAIRAGQRHKIVLRNYRRDGVPFWNHLTIAPLRDEQGRVSHFVGVQMDVTTFQEALLECQRLRAELEQAQTSQWDCLRDVLHCVTENRFHLCRTDRQLPRRLAPASDPFHLGEVGMRLLRRAVLRSSDDIAMPIERSEDFVVAVGEAATNAVVHGGGGHAQVCSDGKAVQVWITDRGNGISGQHLHRAILERGFSTGGTMGYGYWVIICTCDEVWLQTGPEGTTLVLQQGLEAPPPLWLEQVKQTTEGSFGAGKALASW